MRKLLHGCTVCHRYQGKPYSSPEAPPLLSFRFQEALPFSISVIDYVGPLYVRSGASSGLQKVWICLFTCCVTCGVHLEIVPDMTAEAFICCFRRFMSRRGFPCRIVTDNAKTFKAPAKTLEAVLKRPEVKCFFSHINVKWTFNLERAPWWGRVFERMVQTTKRCLRKTIGSARLNYDELLTTITEAEMIVNSRPLSYLSSDDLEEPLTPSHLLIGHRVLSQPDTLLSLNNDLGYELTHEDLSRRVKHQRKVLNDFWRRWRLEYLLDLREAHCHSQRSKGLSNLISVGDIVIIHEENRPRGLWKLGRVEELLKGNDDHVRGAVVRVVASKETSFTVLQRPVQRLYPVEFRVPDGISDPSETPQENSGINSEFTEDETSEQSCNTSEPKNSTVTNSETSDEKVDDSNAQPRRQAAITAQRKMRTWINRMKGPQSKN